MAWPQRPAVYEINTAVWLHELSQAAGRPLTLAEVAGADWDAVAPAGTDAVWLMGVWERSPAGLAVAEANGDLMASFREALPDLRGEDIIGSPYCVRRYVVDASFGGPEGLTAARAALAARGKRLILDYVPNHLAPDAPAVTERPELFIQGTAADLAADPASFLQVGDTVLANGRDPYFPAWPDVVQLNAFAPPLRAATVETLGSIADQCDGIRCDMAMLMINRIFAQTWSGRSGPAPDEEFWPTVIGRLREQHPETVLFAEAYWDLEFELQQQGFDFCYDKRLYDRILAKDVTPLRDHLRADLAYQSGLVRFLENHDEPRIAARVEPAAERAAAVAIATLPGATLWHEGQFTGRRVRPPVFLRRRPDEDADKELADWYAHLLAVVGAGPVRAGDWCLLEAEGWPDNQTCRHLLTWEWSGDATADRFLIVINFSAEAGQARIRVSGAGLAGRSVQLVDLLSGAEFDRDGDELGGPGLFVGLEPWQCYLLRIR